MTGAPSHVTVRIIKAIQSQGHFEGTTSMFWAYNITVKSYKIIVKVRGHFNSDRVTVKVTKSHCEASNTHIAFVKANRIIACDIM